MCIFCDISSGKIVPADIVFENEHVIAFRDINPVAPSHVLVIPKKHIRSMHEIGGDEISLLGEMILAVQKVAEKEGILKSGYRIVTNVGADAGQTVDHLHWHVIGGRKLGWEF
ncbi:MAG: histidine triad nucleotide-binding protein [Patescibacteria group bacterium]|nr:histidine triad nucleotide-binding protein [Patescibacteria group bacterium]